MKSAMKRNKKKHHREDEDEEDVKRSSLKISLKAFDPDRKKEKHLTLHKKKMFLDYSALPLSETAHPFSFIPQRQFITVPLTGEYRRAPMTQRSAVAIDRGVPDVVAIWRDIRKIPYNSTRYGKGY
ncbi:hypothetical protein CEXT_494121 [Caerostris extrusa]|uniref:Uncharacterized protein n=1 Tax=Caerostris extrusa TaxID=172846 RepID=A0AAV4SML8_CAEEX|nr:hypothetical protein CEXT_494121 [Caerostris extrusa]